MRYILVPDLAVVTSLDGIELCFTTQFYCLLRGILDQNLGELLIPQPDTIPIELLQLPERTYATVFIFPHDNFHINFYFRRMSCQNTLRFHSECYSSMFRYFTELDHVKLT